MAVSLVNPPPCEVGEPTKTLGLQCFDAATELRELLLGLRIRQLGDRLGAPLNDGCQLAHLPLHQPPAPSCRLERTFDSLLHGYDTPVEGPTSTASGVHAVEPAARARSASARFISSNPARVRSWIERFSRPARMPSNRSD